MVFLLNIYVINLLPEENIRGLNTVFLNALLCLTFCWFEKNQIVLLIVWISQETIFSLQLLLQLVIDHLSDFSFTPGVFEMVKEELKKTYFNMLIKSEVLAKWVSVGKA